MGKYLGLIALALVPALWTAWAARGLPHLGAYHDDGIYWVAAKSLATGQGYTQIHLPGEPPQTKYPPMYPMMLAAAWWTAAPENVALAITWLGLPVLVALSVVLFRRLEFQWPATAVMAALVAVNPHSQISATRLMADLPGAGWLWGCLLVCRRSPLAAGFLAGVAFLTRTAYLPLIVLLPAWYAWRRDRRAALQCMATSIPMVVGWGWFTATQTVGAKDPVMSYYTSYLSFQMSQMSSTPWLERVWANVGSLTTAIAHLLLLAVGESPVEQCIRYVLVVAALTGVYRLARKPEGELPAAFLAIYSLELLVWYYEPNPRFLYPLLPLLVAGFWVELSRFVQSIAAAFLTRGWGNRIVAGVLSAALLYLASTVWWQGSMLWEGAGVPMLDRDRARLAQRELLYDWVRRETPVAARFYSVHDPVFYLHTGRQAMRSPLTEEMFTRAKDGAVGPSDRMGGIAQRFGLQYAVLTSADAVDQLSESRGITGIENGAGFTAEFVQPIGVVWRLDSSQLQAFK